MVRASLVAVLLVTGCASGSSRGPAWPKRTDPVADGGESLAPRAGAQAIAAVVETDDDDDVKVVTPAAPATPTTAAAAATTTTPTTTAPDEPVQVEEIVIEISDE